MLHERLGLKTCLRSLGKAVIFVLGCMHFLRECVGLGAELRSSKMHLKKKKQIKKKKNNFSQLLSEIVDNIELNSNIYSRLDTDGANAKPSTTTHSLVLLSLKR